MMGDRATVGQGRTRILFLASLAPGYEQIFPHGFCFSASPANSPAVSHLCLEYQKPPDTVGEVGSGGSEGGEARGAGRGARDRAEPGGEALDIDRGRGRHVLEVRLG